MRKVKLAVNKEKKNPMDLLSGTLVYLHRRTGGVSTNPQSTQRQAGADDKMNPTISTGTASYMGVRGPEPSPQGLYRAAYMGAGKRPYPKDTAASGSRRRDESNYHHRNSVLYGSEWTRTITTGSIQSSLYGSGQATVSQGHSGP